MDRIKRNMDIFIILMVGFALRFAISFTHSYSNDELSAINRLQYDNFAELIKYGVKTGDMHPAGVQVFMKAWSQVAGTNEIWMRLPFVLCGTISILLIFLIGKKWVNRQAGIIAAIFLSLLYFPILNSEFARPYSPGLMFTLLAAWYYLKVLFDENSSFTTAVLLALSLSAAMYTHHFSFLFVGWMSISAFIYWTRDNFKYVLLAGGLALVFYIPHIPITQYQTSLGGLGWLGAPDDTWLVQFIFHLFNESWWVLTGVMFLLLLSFLLKEKTQLINKRMIFLSLIWFFGIYVLAHIYSVKATPILKYPVMLFAAPFFILPLAFLLSKFRYQLIQYALLMILIATSTTRERALFGNMHFELFEEIAEDMVRWNDDYGAENIYTVYNINNPNYMNFYANQWGKEIEFDWDVIEFWSAGALREDLMKTSEEYCVVGYSGRLTKPEIFETCKEFFPNILEYRKYNNSAVFLLAKNRPSQLTQHRALLSRCTVNNYAGWEFDPTQLRTDSIPLNRSDTLDSLNQIERFTAFVLDSINTHGPLFRFRLNQIDDPYSKYIKVSVYGRVHAVKENGQSELTAYMSADRDGQQLMKHSEAVWQGADLETMMAEGKGYFVFKVHEFLQPTDEIRIGVYSRNPNVKSWVTAIEIEVYDNIWN